MKIAQQPIAAGQSFTLSAVFPIRGARVDNFTSQWLRLAGSYWYVAPYTYDAIIPLNGAGAVAIGPEAPPEITQAAAIAGEQYVLTVYSDQLPVSGGIAIPTWSTPTGRVAKHVSVITAGTPVALAAAPTVVRQAAIQGLPANTKNIYLAPVGVTPSTQGWVLPPGASISVAFYDLSLWQIDADVNGESAAVLGVT